MSKDIQMAKDLIITDEIHEKFQLNDDPESEQILCKLVFEFLMPGFLYSHKEFEQRFAVPITKNKD